MDTLTKSAQTYNMDAANRRLALIDEYLAYRKQFNRAPNPWSAPNEREEAGFCLQHPAPLQIFDNSGAPKSWQSSPFWSRVRCLIVEALAEGAGR
ncbi:hypothetical protein LCGC14_2696460 [marine sediment metagenome]|uniref:Uncharacterized protein n=1 Tax=marine sediment metagenome TaxID=412755 RepID=A0A0F9BRG3_9ZZZZ